ncbi:type IV pilus assembly protein PilM [Ferrimonas sediminum]|uniref:Type IV pilus assembly protein PilM n=1 Tax=Ferrimonas sediminum TaxID=718193 RepID=A0A1G8V6I7_9GAMM|nr:type IV pilus assembly protein PilM [Ferrimonas sediminum]SDJ61653.1 type IV pilus assembly protein PilM [Ferrimonas sediminum]
MLSLFFRSAPTFVGVDIGTSHIKAVVLECAGNEPRIGHACCVAIDRAEGDDALPIAMKRLQQQLPAGCERGAAAVSGATVMTKVITMDIGLSDLELETQIEIEADSLIPYPLDEVNLDFERLGAAESNRIEILLSACRREDVHARVEALAAADLHTEVVDVEAYALGRAAAMLAVTETVVALVDIGVSKASVAINCGEQTAFVRELSLGSRDQMAPDDAYPDVAQLAQQLQRTFQIYVNGDASKAIGRVMICGDVAELLLQQLQAALSIPCSLAQPRSVPLSGPLPASAYMVACGLALRGNDDPH